MNIEAMKQALEALEYAEFHDVPGMKRAVEKLSDAIEQAEKDKARFEDFVGQLQEVEKQACEIINREWVGLTDDDMYELRRKGHHHLSERDFLAIEAKLKEKNAT